jgi:sulfoxide reductase heme-binding subunit YedZ
MTLRYQAVGWNPQKKRYDRALALGVLGYLALFVGVSTVLHPNATAETLIIRGVGTAAFLLLHVILAIGPLCRIDRRFLPLLYNRRHLGMCMFLLALVHGGFSILQFHGFGDTNPILSVFIANTRYDSLAQFPFQPLGFLALGILFVMAATSHDYWLANLTAPVWKALHMLVYVAYALLVGHVALGSMQSEPGAWLPTLLGVGAAAVIALHLVVGWRERASDDSTAEPGLQLVDVCAVDDIPEKRAHLVTLAGDRVAVFRYDGRIAAVSNACQHQNGPLGEGRIIDGTITCPWHGYQYDPACGRSPEPFTERVPTFRTEVRDGRVFVDPRPLPSGTPVEPSFVDGRTASPESAYAPTGDASEGPPGRDPDDGSFYVGYLPQAPADLASLTRRRVLATRVVAWAVGLTIASAQRPFALSTFEYLELREFAGRLEEDPVPSLLVTPPGDGPPQRFLLVSEFKWGAAGEVAGLDGESVTLTGTLAYRDGKTLVEIVPGSVKAVSALGARGDQAGEGPGSSAAGLASDGSGRSEPSIVVPLGKHTLRGEIVDSKCFLGVMNPGDLKVHRACAARCISGGIPPVLVVRDRRGVAAYLVLIGSDGRLVNDEVLAMIAEPLEVTGLVERHDDLLVLRADPDTYRRLSDGFEP